MSRVLGSVLGHQLRAAVRSRWLAMYAGFFFVVTAGLLRYGGGEGRAMLSLLSIVLFVVPLVSLVLGTVYLYGAREFTEVLLAQPVRRSALFAGLYGGLSIPLGCAVVGGVALPFLFIRSADPVPTSALLTLLGAAVALTLVFAGLAFIVALRADDRLRGLGLAIGIWLLLAFVYDGAILTLTSVFADYPLERPLLVATLLNPVDLARVLLMLRLDTSALLGYTGAVFQQFFSGAAGVAAAAGALVVWMALPALAGARVFARKDF